MPKQDNAFSTVQSSIVKDDKSAVDIDDISINLTDKDF